MVLAPYWFLLGSWLDYQLLAFLLLQKEPAVFRDDDHWKEVWVPATSSRILSPIHSHWNWKVLSHLPHLYHSVAVCCPASREDEVWIDHVHFATWPIKLFIFTYIRQRELHPSSNFLLGLAKTLHLWSGRAIIGSTCPRVIWQFFSHSWVTWTRWEAQWVWKVRKGIRAPLAL